MENTLKDPEKIIAEHLKLKNDYSVAMMEIQFLKQEVKLLKHKLFGKSSERFVPAEPIQTLFDEPDVVVLEAEVLEKSSSEECKVEEHETTENSKPKVKPVRKPLPASLERVEVVHDIPEEDRVCDCGCRSFSFVGADVSEQLDVIPAKFRVLKHIRNKYACNSCKQNIVTAPRDSEPIPRSFASPALLGYLCVSKYADALPLYRLSQIFLNRDEIEVSRSVMAQWIVACGKLILPLVKHIKSLILSKSTAHADETTVQVLKENGKTAESKSYMWVLCSGIEAPYAVVFEYQPGRGSEYAKELLGDFRGYLHADRYSGYNAVFKLGNVCHVACLAHARRKFDEVYKIGSANSKGFAEEVIFEIQKLWKIESEIKELPAEEKVIKRIQSAEPIFNELKAKFEEKQLRLPPKSRLGGAISYMLADWESFTRYLHNGSLSIDNSRAENAIRPFAIGRRNWLFSHSTHGAEASAALYSLLSTARQHGVPLYSYMAHVLSKMAHLRDKIPPDSPERQKFLDELLPWNCKNQFKKIGLN